MKNQTLFVLAVLCAFVSYGQVSVTVDASKIIKRLNGMENGINLDYLVDDAYLNAATSTTAAIRNMGVKLLRYPGGEKSDNYLWSAAPWTAASPRMALTDKDYYWPTDDSRFVDVDSPEKLCKSVVLDFDELMTMCRQTGAQPLIVVAYDAMYNSCQGKGKPTKAQLLTNAVEWVRYANVYKHFGIKYWMIGNESWNEPDYNGRVSAEQYAADLVEFASAMKAIDPTIKIIANGKSDWWKTLLQSKAVSWIDILAFSLYPTWNYTGGYDYFRKNNVNLTGEADAAIKAINDYAPAADKARLKVLASEYNSIDWSDSWKNANDLGHALSNFQIFGDMVKKPQVESLCMWNTRWQDVKEQPKHVYNALDENGNFNAIGTAQAIWGNNLLHTLVNATSSHNIVKTYATYDTISKSLNVFILNKDTAAKKVKLNITNYSNGYGGSRWAFTGSSTDDLTPAYRWVEAISEPADISSLTVPPTSVTVLKLLSPFVTMPVRLISFDGVMKNGKAQLQWKVADETELSHYEVEKQLSPGTFEKISVVNAGNKGEFSYEFIVPQFTYGAPNYYRLKIVGNNNSRSYSEVVRLQSSSYLDILKAAITPNPVMGQSVQLQFIAGRKQTIEATVIDYSGKVHWSKKLIVEAGVNNVVLTGNTILPRGTYWLHVNSSQQPSQVVQFIKK